MASDDFNIHATTSSQSNQITFTVFTVPPDRQLIIDYVSLRAQVPAGERIHSAFMNLPHVHFFVVHSQGQHISGHRIFTAAQQVRIVVEAGSNVVFRAERNKFGTTAFLSVSLAGRLVPAEPGES